MGSGGAGHTFAAGHGLEIDADSFALEAWQGRLTQIQVPGYKADTGVGERDPMLGASLCSEHDVAAFLRGGPSPCRDHS